MNRDELLHLASQCQFSQGISLAMAKDMRTAEDIDRALATLSERKVKAKAWSKVFGRMVLATVVAGVSMVLAYACDVVRMTSQAAVFMSAGFVVTLVAAIVKQAIADATCADLAELEKKLAPVVNSSNCKSALEYVQAGKPAVLAWRDLAIAEREVLRVFDVMVMRDLHFASIEAEKEVKQQRENEEACRELYGIVPTQAKAE